MEERNLMPWAKAAVGRMLAKLTRETAFELERWRLVLGEDE